ncbi:MAG: YchF/TatD family DNA exonuclease [Armatimonadia bacterium]|nr:YchF/TatD family DNA exonuclease [Armatimonadia bacterium]
MPLVDSHCHLNHDELHRDLYDALDQAQKVGVERMVVVGYDLVSSKRAIAQSRAHLSIVAAVGLHPHDASDYSSAVADELRALARSYRTVAYGEIGLDYHYDNSPRETQRAAFERQLAVAEELRLPVIIHSRDAADDTRAIVEDHTPLPAGGVMHCFTYGVEEMEWAVELGLHVGITGVITFKKAEEVREVAAAVPLERLLIETDSPYMAPVPYRGRTNQPAFLPEVAVAVAQAREISPAEVEAATTRNASLLFGELVRV